jgi:RimJ/RimL family protein N-acetyltransferase
LSDVSLDQIRLEDLEFLRQLRNAERRWFFDQREITSEAQAAWHRSLSANPDHHWYLVRVDHQPAGCFSIKVGSDGRAYIGSILLAPEFRGQGVMTRAMGTAMDGLGSHLRYYTEVLADNDPSLDLFNRLGFTPRFVTLERAAK